MSKAQRIRALYSEGKTTAEIAAIVGCDPAYARVAGRQRRNGRNSKADINYYRRFGGDTLNEALRLCYKHDPLYRARMLRGRRNYDERQRSARGVDSSNQIG